MCKRALRESSGAPIPVCEVGGEAQEWGALQETPPRDHPACPLLHGLPLISRGLAARQSKLIVIGEYFRAL
jgi:hypothetical protein